MEKFWWCGCTKMTATWESDAFHHSKLISEGWDFKQYADYCDHMHRVTKRRIEYEEVKGDLSA